MEEFIREQESNEKSLPFKKQVKNIPDFFYTEERSKPVIPGSSLRGMLRSLLEIVSYSKMKWVTDEKLLLQKKLFDKNPLDNVPPELRRPEDVDYAEAIFGFTRTEKELQSMLQRKIIDRKPKQGEKGHAYAGRVSVTDACLLGGQQDIWWSSEPITPKILASPKPTAFQHYLVQPDSDKEKLKDYDSDTPEETVIRGHKRYWLQGERRINDIKEKEGNIKDSTHTNLMLSGPVLSLSFAFTLKISRIMSRRFVLGLRPQGDPDKTATSWEWGNP